MPAPRRAILAACLAAACGSTPEPEPAPPITLEAPRADAITLDGELDDAAWRSVQPTARFVDATRGVLVPPYTEARVVCERDALVVAIYAADEDLRSSDRVGLVLHRPDGATFVVEVSPAGDLLWHAPGAAGGAPPTGVAAAIDADGTLDHDDLEDEEWIAEIRVPWSALGRAGAGDVRANFFRRDQPRDGTMRTLAWTPWREHPSSDVATLGLVRCAR
jgi:hypothetical protein